MQALSSCGQELRAFGASVKGLHVLLACRAMTWAPWGECSPPTRTFVHLHSLKWEKSTAANNGPLPQRLDACFPPGLSVLGSPWRVPVGRPSVCQLVGFHSPGKREVCKASAAHKNMVWR